MPTSYLTVGIQHHHHTIDWPISSIPLQCGIPTQGELYHHGEQPRFGAALDLFLSSWISAHAQSLLLTGIPSLRQKVAVVVGAAPVRAIGTTRKGGIRLFTYPTHQLTPYQRGKSTSSKEHDYLMPPTILFFPCICIHKLMQFYSSLSPTHFKATMKFCIAAIADLCSNSEKHMAWAQRTKAPTTKKPTSPKPITIKPTKVAPTTTKKPTSRTPLTIKPTTVAPTTKKPTSPKPNTNKPITVAPTTKMPSTSTTVYCFNNNDLPPTVNDYINQGGAANLSNTILAQYGEIGSWCTKEVTNMAYMFYSASNF